MTASKHHPGVNVILIYIFLSAIAVTTVFPLLWMLAASLKDPQSDVADLVNIVPKKICWENYGAVLSEPIFLRAFLNSVFVTVSVTAGSCFTSSLAAYAFARMSFRGRDKIFMGYLATLMIPGSVTIIPSFLILRAFGWIDTYLALIAPSVFSAYGTFMLRQFFLSLPRDLEEAAVIDGCNSWEIYIHVVLPLSKNAMITLAILTFMGQWQSFMWPLIVTYSSDLYTLPLALAKFKELHGIQWTLLMAGSVIMLIPMLLVFIFGQKLFTKGITMGAVKG